MLYAPGAATSTIVDDAWLGTWPIARLPSASNPSIGPIVDVYKICPRVLISRPEDMYMNIILTVFGAILTVSIGWIVLAAIIFSYFTSGANLTSNDDRF